MINPLKSISPLTPKQRQAREHTLNVLLQEVDKAPAHKQPQIWQAIKTHERVISHGQTVYFQGSFV